MLNKRKRMRIDGSYKGQLTVDGRELPFKTKNLSLKGMLAETTVPVDVSPGTGCVVDLPLTPEISININCRVVRSGGQKLALDFTGMDEESYKHLSACVRSMSPNPDAVEREQSIPAFKE